MAEDDAFRAEVRAWLETNCPPEKRGIMKEGDHCMGGRNWKFKNDAQRVWLERMAGRGWTAPEWPKEYGGGGLSPVQAKILRQEMARIKAHSPLTSIGLMMWGPALLRYGTEEQKRKYVPGIVKGEVLWCQGYSEPNAGSDLASLQTRAEVDGDSYVINGGKIWTSYGHIADMMFCLTRTDPSKPKHDGISFILIDMTTPGVQARPLRMISGNEHFSQVFFDNVRVPKANLVGEFNRGWDVAKYLMQFERQSIGTMMSSNSITRLSDFVLKHVGTERLRAEPMLRAQIVKHEIEVSAFEVMAEEYITAMAGGKNLGAKSSLLKYLATELAIKSQELTLSSVGSAGLDTEGDYAKAITDWLQALPNRVGGGTSEIQVNVVAKRVLELPGA
jgi:acyl-CoA dehydrogenase